LCSHESRAKGKTIGAQPTIGRLFFFGQTESKGKGQDSDICWAQIIIPVNARTPRAERECKRTWENNKVEQYFKVDCRT